MSLYMYVSPRTCVLIHVICVLIHVCVTAQPQHIQTRFLRARSASALAFASAGSRLPGGVLRTWHVFNACKGVCHLRNLAVFVFVLVLY